VASLASLDRRDQLRRSGSAFFRRPYINKGGDSSAVADQLSSGVSQIVSSRDAFAALKADGSVVSWGGSGGDSSAVAS
jgi:hypothetical protein